METTMTRALIPLRAGPAMTIQDLGRPGYMAYGLSQGGAADPLALIEGTALLGQNLDCAALEMAGIGGVFEATADLRIALTGAPMPATLDGQAIAWNASHKMQAGQHLSIGAASSGVYGYLHVGGGFDAPSFLNSRATHLTAGIGAVIATGDPLPITPDPNPDQTGLTLPVSNRTAGGTVRVLPSVQTHLFPPETLHRFAATTFTRTARGNRQGVELAFDGDPFALPGQLTILSEPMLMGDIQMTGSGAPYVLLPECQTTGGYPRIATVIPDDLPLLAQAATGTQIRFNFIDHTTATAAHKPWPAQYAALKAQRKPLIRDPREIRDLLSYQLISGAITGWEPVP